MAEFRAIAGLLFALVVVGCSVDLSIGGEDPAEAAERLIETDLATEIGLGAIEATCESPETVDVGTTWNCTGVNDAGTLEFGVEVDREDHILVGTKNVMLADQLAGLAQAATGTLSEAAGVELPADAIDCGQESVLLPEDTTVSCVATIGSETFDVPIAITDLETTAYEFDTTPMEGALLSWSFQQTAGEVIEGELADLIGLGAIDGSCEEPTSLDVGATFACTGQVADQTAQFVATIAEGQNVNVNTANVVLANQVGLFSTAAMQQLNEAFGQSAPDEAMDCGTASIVLSSENQMVCALDAGAEIYDATITITDMMSGAFIVEVAETPRG